jgi:NADH:ubiquinone oxidoreductase subunit 5 (subunit L)/multisubunit Na+/H+ antiporter MnhA subunit
MAHEQPLGIIIPIVILSILAITFGYIAREAAVGIGNSLSAAAEIGVYNNPYLIEADFGLSLFTKNFPLICTSSGVLFGFLFFV